MNDSDTQETSSYDAIPYTAMSFPQQNPARIGAVGRLYGLHPASPANCRFLELGCGQGFTSLMLAQLYPRSQFLAVDTSAVHIDQAAALAGAAGLTNITFEVRDILDLSRERDGEFDYITCHGVFSWVPDPVREKILAVCREQLKPSGIAYISYNALPGWSHLNAIREILRYHTARYSDPAEKYEKAKAFMALLHENAPEGSGDWLRPFLGWAASYVQGCQQSYFLHEFLAEHNQAYYFHEFMAMAARHNLQFVSEARLSDSLPGSLGPKARPVVEVLKRSVVDAEQYIDFVKHTQFRMTLLCHKDAPLRRSLGEVPLKEYVFSAAFRASSHTISLDEGTPEAFLLGPHARMESSESFFKAVLLFFSTKPNLSMSLSAIYDGAMSLLKSNEISVAPHAEAQGIQATSRVVSHLLAAGLCEISLPEVGEFVPVTSVPKNPFVPPLARAQAEARVPVLRTNFNSRPLPRELSALVTRCDGTLSQSNLFAYYTELVQNGHLHAPAPRKPGQAADLKAAFVEILRELGNAGVFWQPVEAGQSSVRYEF